MTDLITVRIYFEHGQKVHNQSFWKKIYASDFSVELLKRAKAFGLQQVLHLNVSKGYLNHQKINWGVHEVKPKTHPQLIEITDAENKVNGFLEEQKDFLINSRLLLVRNEVLMK